VWYIIIVKARGKKLSEAARLLSLSRKRFRGKPKRMYPCPYCASEFSAAEFRRHVPRCQQGGRGQSTGFWHSQSLEELVRQQGVSPVAKLEELEALWPADGDPDEFLTFILSERRARRRAEGDAP